MQVLRDICVVARAETPVSGIERNLLDDIADKLELPADFVTQCLSAPIELD